MRLFTLFTLLALFTLQPLMAEVDTIYVKDFEYDDDTTDIDLGDTIIFQWVEGDHPTASDNGDWTTFPMNASNPTKMLVLSSTGTYPYHCTTHGGPGGQGMAGVIIVEDAATGIAQTELEVDAKIYPNPAAEQATVTFDRNVFNKIEVINMVGQPMEVMRVADDEKSKQLDIRSYETGNYLVALYADGRIVKSLRLVKK